MALPKAVQEQMDAAAVIEAAIAVEQGAPPQGNTPEAPAPVPVAAPAAPQATPEAQPAPAVVEGFETKYNVLRGKYEAEVPRLHQQLKETTQRLDELARQRAEAPPPEAPPKPVESLVTQQDETSFGADLMAVIARVASDTAAIAEARLRQEFGGVKKQVGQIEARVEESAEDAFWGKVRGVVPDWDAVDTDPRWSDWLNTSPEFSELTYRQLAGAAISSGNAPKIAALVKTWKSTVSPAEPAADAPPAQPTPSPQTELARQVAPKTSNTSLPPAPAGRIWTHAEYQLAYDPRHVKQIGKEAAEALQAEADQAVAEGRVDWR